MRLASGIRVEELKDREQICQLVNGVWAQQYQNQPLLPKWTPTFFDWQFLRAPAGWATVCLGIYLKDQLVGLFCGDCWTLLLDGVATRATLLSCVSVSSKARHPAIAEAGLNGLRAWSERHDAYAFIGFVNPASSYGAGRRYWTTRRGYVHAFSSLSRQWQINPMTVAVHDKLNDRTVSGTIDQAASLLMQQLGALADSGIATLACSEARLRHQLGFDALARCVVVEQGGEIGVCSFYMLPSHGAGALGYIDFITSSTPDGPLAEQAFARALAQMKAQRCERAFVLGQPHHSVSLLTRLGFRPCLPSYTPLIVSWDLARPLPKNGLFCSPIFR